MPAVVEAHVQRSAAVHVVLEFSCTKDQIRRKSHKIRRKREHTDGRLSLCDLPELHDTAALGARALEEDLSQLDGPCCLKQLNEVLVRR